MRCHGRPGKVTQWSMLFFWMIFICFSPSLTWIFHMMKSDRVPWGDGRIYAILWWEEYEGGLEEVFPIPWWVFTVSSMRAKAFTLSTTKACGLHWSFDCLVLRNWHQASVYLFEQRPPWYYNFSYDTDTRTCSNPERHLQLTPYRSSVIS